MPPRNVGTHSLADLLKRKDVTPVQYGLDTIAADLARDLAVHNRLTTDLVETYAVISSDTRRRYGVSDIIEFRPADEYSRMHTQKAGAFATVEFPLERYDAAIGWTADFFRQKSVSDMASTQQAAERGHLQNIRNRLQAALYGVANYDFDDDLDTGITLHVKRFVNADGAPIPQGPNGENFNAATHTHYLFSDGLTDAGATALVDTVSEHTQNGRVVVHINKADAASWQALDNFKEFTDVRLTPSADGGEPIRRLDPFKPDDREIGYYGVATVVTKPWALPNYATALDMGQEVAKPLIARTRTGGSIAMATIATNVLFPIQADFMRSEYGFGVWNRTAGAVLYHAPGAVAYVEPALVALT